MSARNSGAWLALARVTRNTSVPFLYQTRTLSAVPGWRYPHWREHIQTASISTEAQQQRQKQDATTTGSSGSSANESTPSKPRSGRRSFLKRKAASVSPLADTTTTAAQPSITGTQRPVMTSSEKQAFGELLETLGVKPDTQADAPLAAWPPPPPQPSSADVSFYNESSESSADSESLSKDITDEERQEISQISAIFESVLQDLKERKVRQQRQEQRKLEQQGKSSLVMADSTSYHAGGDDPAALPGSTSMVEFIETRMRSGDFVNAQLADWVERRLVTSEQAVEAVVLRESRVIEAEMQRSVRKISGDRKIWKTCRETIFPLVRVLEEDLGMGVAPDNADQADEMEVQDSQSGEMVLIPEESSSASVEEQAQGPEQAVIESQEAETPANEDEEVQQEVVVEEQEKEDEMTVNERIKQAGGKYKLTVPAGVPVSSVVAELYPKMLLAAFRLLNLHFPMSSLIGQFRATIRLMGPTSAMLGGSTGLYNDLIYFYWRGCQDLPAVVALMREMEVTGVEPDARTVRILSSINTQRTRDLKTHWQRHVSSLPARKDPSEKVHVGRETWWDLAPNRKAYWILCGKDGYVDKLKARYEELQRNEQPAKASQSRSKA
ncbi:uncharacterized protein BP01DRAFT_355217 [Aspergillus saccharolyticus JOP 1030-1]|uniref:Mtf2-like C-terminal domain-containing protein n=1 Tax=Aspergillus saccharolyticus JOP 1030-1 TaxID=1450539 RepID=A0A318ZIX6_9EURO|nr:hypothetical protein BP01DRAFT_355217 [Aspergillus saccharolyticus JOP 1030-1]PYH46815.1 hypothetical protein BP01DRAFT_355217 [Aspergillus saccharolyticus JOP 1030-1]